MFKENIDHLQPTFFDMGSHLSETRKKRLEESEENTFYNMVFCRINEKDFQHLYSDNGSRPNAPVNRMVSAVILKEKKGWTIKEMKDQVDFNLKTRRAIGMNDFKEESFCEATYFNFCNKLLAYYVETGENLLEQVFDGLTREQLKELKIKADVQRTDSFQAMSNIRSYTRLQLLIEILIRLYREMKETDRETFKELVNYTNQSSGQYIYNLSREDIPHELNKLAELYCKLYTELKDDYGDIEIFKRFARVYEEHFTVADEKIKIKPAEELHSGMLQSPDDVDATYRKKNDKEYHGQSVNIVETANPENELQLLTDITVDSNNTDDDKILKDRLDKIKEKTPELEEMHTDGGYGSETTDEKMEEANVRQVQTDIRGRKSDKIQMHIHETGEDEYEVECPKQKVKAQKARKRYKANFKADICSGCEYKMKCSTQIQKKGRVYYFDRSKYLLDKRRRVVETLPPQRRNLRPNVEATVKEFKTPLNHKGKLRVRGRFKTMMYACGVGIGINLGRIHRYLRSNPQGDVYVGKFFEIIDEIDGKIMIFLKMFTTSAQFAGFGAP